MKPSTIALALAVAACVASPAAAEVMDKEPTRIQIWTGAGVLSVAGVLAWSQNRWIGLATTFAAILFAWAIIAELWDPHVGRAILAEAGVPYVRGAYQAVMVCLAVHAVAATIRLGGWSKRFRPRLKGSGG